jgi:hypothetical protein
MSAVKSIVGSTMAPGDSERQTNVRWDSEGHFRLEQLARHYGIGAVAVIRMLVSKEHDRLFGERPARARAPRRRGANE